MENMTDSYNRFLAGDASGLAQIICTYKDGLILYLTGFVRDISLAEELTEETFVKLVLKRPRFSGNAAFKTWLYTIARNVAIDHLRRKKKVEISAEDCKELVDEKAHLERAYLQQEQKLRLHAAIEQLKPEYRQVLWLFYFEQFAHKEIARIMGKSTHNVEMLASRARQALKTILNKEGFVYEEL